MKYSIHSVSASEGASVARCRGSNFLLFSTQMAFNINGGIICLEMHILFRKITDLSLCGSLIVHWSRKITYYCHVYGLQRSE